MKKLVKENLNEDGGYTVDDAIHNINMSIRAATEDLSDEEYAEFFRELMNIAEEGLKSL